MSVDGVMRGRSALSGLVCLCWSVNACSEADWCVEGLGMCGDVVDWSEMLGSRSAGGGPWSGCSGWIASCRSGG